MLKDYYIQFRKLTNIGFTVVLVCYLLISSRPYYSSYSDLISVIDGKKTLTETYISKGTTADSVFTIKKTFQAVDFIENNSAPNDKIYVWGIEPLIYYLSGRDCASRFTYNTPLYWRGDNQKYREEFISEIETNRPAMVLVAKRDPMQYITGYNETSEQMLTNFPEFKSILDSKYKYLAEIAEFAFYKRYN